MVVDIPALLAPADDNVTAARGVRILQYRPGRVVAKVQTASGPVVVKASADAGAFVAELLAIRKLAAHGLPVATVVEHAAGPPSYLVLSWIDASPLTSASPRRAQRACGEVLRRVHAIGGEAEAPPEDSWDTWMAGWLNTALAWWAEADSPGEARIRQVWAWFRDLAPLLATRGRDLILFDGRPAHILVRGGDVAGLIDVAELRAGDAAMDLGVLAVTEPAVLPQVLEGYRATPDERAVFARLVPFYTLLRAISYAEWLQEFGTAGELGRALSRLASMEIPG